MSDKPKTRMESSPGDGIRSLPTSRLFRVVNFELYTKPVISIVVHHDCPLLTILF